MTLFSIQTRLWSVFWCVIAVAFANTSHPWGVLVAMLIAAVKIGE